MCYRYYHLRHLQKKKKLPKTYNIHTLTRKKILVCVQNLVEEPGF